MKIKTITLKKGFSVKELGGEFCIVKNGDSNNGAVNGLPSINETGIFLWDRLMRGVTTPETLTEAVAVKNNLDMEDAEADVGEFLAKLINGNLVDIE
ncbi:MAG: hypothetical protein K0R05_1805 [Anaerocolumna sp.]|jgi:hypothetical protein|nr:hypothetical protein [Anaerocolumna sp.]